MTRQLGEFASTVCGAAFPALGPVIHAAQKLFVAGLRGLQTMGVPYDGAAALLGFGCAAAVFLTIWLVFRGLGQILSATARAGRAGASRLATLASKTTPADEPSAAAPEFNADPNEPFVPLWSPGGAHEFATAAAPAPAAGAERRAPAPPTMIRRAPSRPTPASVAAASGVSRRLGDIGNPLVQDEVPPGFLFVDTSPAAPAVQPAAEAEPAASVPPPIPFPVRPASMPAMSIEEAIKFASELQETRDRGSLDRVIARGGRTVIAS
jgi:hypothetical protein